jgi:hypothetical protein
VLDLRLFKLPTFRTATLTGGFSRFAIGSVPFLLPLLLQVGFGLDPLQSGLLTFVTSLGQLLNKTMVRAMLRQFGFRNLLTANSMMLGLMICGIATFTAESPHWQLWVYLVVYGFVRSVQFTSVNALTYSDLTPTIMSRGTSLSSVVQQLCMSFGVAIAASLLTLNTGALRLAPEAGSHVSGHRGRPSTLATD